MSEILRGVFVCRHTLAQAKHNFAANIILWHPKGQKKNLRKLQNNLAA